MGFEQFLDAKLPHRLSAVKRLILKTLWEEGDTWPRGWVKSSRLLELTGQKYFDRRTRELRDECGLDIETKQIYGEHHYRLNSAETKEANPRAYLTEAQKRSLFIREKYTCQICGTVAEAGVRGLQADHKIPLIRGGTHEAHNWQSICNVCNVSKRRACQDCELKCEECPWAFPEKLGMALTIRLPRGLFDEVQERQIKDQDWLARLLKNAVRGS